MNTANTIPAFDQVVVPVMAAVSTARPHQTFEFEGDNARAHTSVRFRNHLAALPYRTTPFGGHPVNAPGGRAPTSPDMCPMEPILGIWQEKVYRRNPRMVRQLMDIADEEWTRIPMAVIQRTIRHMLQVMESIEANGGAQYGYQQ